MTEEFAKLAVDFENSLEEKDAEALAASIKEARGDAEESTNEEGELQAIKAIDAANNNARGGAHASFHRSGMR